MGKRHRAREVAVQCIYQWEVTGHDPAVIFAGFYESQGSGEPAVKDFAEELFEGTVRNTPEIDEIISGQSEHWRMDRLGLVEKSILRLAVYEFLHEPATPPVVAINEAVELCKRFCGPESGPFVNGVLDAVNKNLQSGGVKEP